MQHGPAIANAVRRAEARGLRSRVSHRGDARETTSACSCARPSSVMVWRLPPLGYCHDESPQLSRPLVANAPHATAMAYTRNPEKKVVSSEIPGVERKCVKRKSMSSSPANHVVGKISNLRASLMFLIPSLDRFTLRYSLCIAKHNTFVSQSY
jgi:hypothetical protein